MRYPVYTAGFIAAVAFSGAVIAQTSTVPTQPAPSRTADQIVCEMTGDCGASGLSDQDKLDRSKEAGFSFLSSAPAANTAQPAKRPAVTQPRPTKAVTAPVRPTYAAGKSAPRAITSGLDMRITFANGSADMTPQGRVNAQEFAKALTMPALSGKRYVIEGHTDAVGGRDYNMSLSNQRAQSVASYLRSLGVDSGRLVVKGYGFDRPLPGATPRAAANRRVQIVPAG